MPLKTGSRRFIVLANLFFLSLGANLFLAGWLVGGSFDRPPPGPPNFFRDFEMQVKDRLSDQGQTQLRNVIDALRAKITNSMPEALTNRKNLAAQISGQTFDSQKLRATLLNAIESRNLLDRASLDLITAFLEKLDAADRLVIADFILHARPPGPGPGFGPPPGQPPN